MFYSHEKLLYVTCFTLNGKGELKNKIHIRYVHSRCFMVL